MVKSINTSRKLRIAVCHDRLTSKGGSERVAIALAKIFNADLYVTRYSPQKTHPETKELRIYEIYPYTSDTNLFLRSIKRNLSAYYFSKIKNLDNYDVVILSGIWALFAAGKNPNTIWYSHTPSRVLYDLNRYYFNKLNIIKKIPFIPWSMIWRKLDRKKVSRVKIILSNSKNVARRIKNIYNRNAIVIYPPVNISKYKNNPPEDYFLSVQKITPLKRIEIQLKAFEKLPNAKLKIVGESEESKYSRKILQFVNKLPNVEYLGSVSEDELIELYSRSKAVIQTSIDEDFGLVAIEAMASGKPVIAVREGGFKETVLHGQTGILIEKPYVENLRKAINEFDKFYFDVKKIYTHAKSFSYEKFEKKIKKVVYKIV